MMRYAHDNIAEHLDEATVGVHDETFVAGFLDQCFACFGIQAQIEDRVHHAGHGDGGTRAHGHEEGVGALAKGLSQCLFQSRQRLVDLRAD